MIMIFSYPMVSYTHYLAFARMPSYPELELFVAALNKRNTNGKQILIDAPAIIILLFVKKANTRAMIGQKIGIVITKRARLSAKTPPVRIAPTIKLTPIPISPAKIWSP